MSDNRILPVGPTRSFGALADDLDCIKARPGFSRALGGPQLTVAGVTDDYETNDRADILPTRLEWLTDGPIVLRYNLCSKIPEGLGAGTGPLYYDDTREGIAGTVLDVSPDVIVMTGTTAEFALGWPRR